MINSLFTGNRNSLLGWPHLFPNKQPEQPVFPTLPFEGNMSGNKGSPVMAGGMPYPQQSFPAQPFEGGLGSQGKGYGGLYTGQAPMQYGPRQASGGMRRPGGMAIRQKY